MSQSRITSERPHLVLIGLRAAGKTTTGTLLASRLQAPFVDLDTRTAAALGSTSPGEALSQRGIEAFRTAETNALAEALHAIPTILALGGGTPTAPGAADLLRQHRDAGRAFIVYLRLSPATLRARLAGLPSLDSRPSLTGRGTLDEVDELFAQRDPLYRELANLTINADDLSPQQVAESTIAALPRAR